MTATATLLVGDVRERLGDIAPESMQLCVTSPPYFSLRDYGTGRWEGGDPSCDHVERRARDISSSNRLGMIRGYRDHLPEGNAAFRGKETQYRGTCGKCGALRIDQQIGLEESLDCLSWATGAEPCRSCWLCSMREVFRGVRRVLRRDGVLWVNVGDSMSSGSSGGLGGSTLGGGQTNQAHSNRNGQRKNTLPPKNMCLAPSRLALALQSDGWYIRSVAPWVKRSSMPSSVRDRPSTSLEWMIMATREARYFWDIEAVRRQGPGDHERSADTRYHAPGQPEHTGLRAMTIGGTTPNGRNLRDSDWWFDSVGMLLRDEVLGFDVVSEPSSDPHYASFPTRLVREVILAGSPPCVCGECGAPWRRVVERGSKVATCERGRHGWKSGAPADGLCRDGEWQGMPGQAYASQTLGWRPSCPHTDAPRRPATVLDPFCGRATTGVVAMQYGRSFVGVELSEAYAEMARRRLATVEAQPLLDVTQAEAPAPQAEQLAMEVEA